MKRLSVISLTLLSLLTALLVGCGGGHDARITAELDRADSLLRTSDTAAHSAALRQMLALDTARALQSDDALRARHALLLTQAQFKSYLFPSNDSLINIARNYYARHHSSAQDHELYTRSLIYSGYIAQMTGHPQQAMQWYLEAESAADPNDHFNLGYLNMRIAKLYHSNHLNDSIIIRKYTNAYNHFSVSNSPHFQLICLTELGTIFSTQNTDSAIHYISHALNLAQDDPDRFFLATNYTNLSGAYFYIDKFVEAKDCALKALNCGYEPTATEIPKCMMLLSRSYAGLGMIDSAQYYADKVVNVRTLADSVHYFSMKADLAKLQGDSARFIQFSDSSNNGVIGILSKTIDNNLISIEDTTLKGNLSKELKVKNSQKKLLLLCVIALLIIIGVIVVSYKRLIIRRNREALDAITNLKKELEHAQKSISIEKLQIEQEMNHQIAILNESLKEAQQNQKDTIYTEQQVSDDSISVLSSVVEHQLSVMNSLVEHSYHYEHNPKRFLNEFTNAVSTQTMDDNFFKSLREYVAVKYGINFNDLQTQYGLKEDELTVISLSCCNIPTTVIMVCMGYHHMKSVDNKKQKIKKKIGIDSYRDFIESLRSRL